ncbi:MAG: hypothetical protein ABW252_22980 [Polyangiales bacterium]
MEHDHNLRRSRSHSKARPKGRAQDVSKVEIHESGIVPSRPREALQTALSLPAPREQVLGFGASVTSAHDILVVGGRLDEQYPFAALYRITPEGAVRERILRGAPSHLGPCLATDGSRVVVGQPSADGGTGLVSVYRRREHDLEPEVTFEGEPGTAAGARFGERIAIGAELLVLGQAASVSVYRHSPVGWLSAGALAPALPYSWNPMFGGSLGVVRGRVLVGNPVELSGHRAGPGRVCVYRQDADGSMVLEDTLLGDGIEFGRSDRPALGFGASLQVAGDFVLVGTPYEQLPSGASVSRVYVYRVSESGGFARVASIPVPGCEGGVCLVGERLFVLDDALHVLARQGNAFTALARYALAYPAGARLTGCGRLLAIGQPNRGAGEVTLHFPEQL